MPSVSTFKATPLDRILVIDDLPLIPLAFQEVFRSINPKALVEYSENIFTALSAKAWANTAFDLVITGSLQDHYSANLQQAVTELRKRFNEPLIMIYSSAYDPVIIEKMAATGIDAYVHKYESIEEIRRAYQSLSSGEAYVSSIFHTLYYEYGHGVRR
ncbi:MAG: response regulator transcription factor [Bacteroidetes bacterium]|nr:response regulator transcription factor [Bacteroidota bacterium]